MRSHPKFALLFLLVAALSAPATAHAQFPGAVSCADATAHVRPDTSRMLGLCGFHSQLEITRAPQHGQLSPQVRGWGSMRYTPHPGYKGPDSFAFRAAGGPAGAPSAEMKIAVTEENGAPVCNLEDRTISATAQASFYNACYDPDEGDAVRVQVVQAPQPGRFFLSGGTAHYSPYGHIGTASFVLRADDGALTSADESVTVTSVAPQEPVCGDRTQVVRKNRAMRLNVYCTPSNGDFHYPIEFDFIDGLAHGSLIRDMMSARYAPNDDFVGTDEITVRVPWTAGHLSGPLSDPFKITLQVTEAGNAPECEQVSGRMQVRSGRTIDLLTFCHDADGEALDLALPEKPYRGAVSTTGLSQFVYTADAGYSGPDRLSIRASDGINQSPEVKHRIHVLADSDNTSPVCAANTIAAQLTSFAHPGFGGCMDAEGDPLEYVLTQPQHGVAEVGYDFGSTVIRYKPVESFAGEDTFTYQAVDGRGGKSAVVTARVLAAPPPPEKSAPVCGPGETRKVRPGVQSSLWVACREPDKFEVIAPIVVDPPDHGTVKKLDWGPETWSYTAEPGYKGTDKVVFRAENAAGHGEIAFTFEVDADNNVAPTCYKQREMTLRTTGSVTASCYDGDGDALTQALVTPPQHGTITGDPAAGRFTYTADSGYAGVDSFVYSADDGHGGITSMTQMVRVRGEVANVSPDCGTGMGYGVDPGGSVDIYWTCSDADGDAFTTEVVTPPAHGTITPGMFGGLKYTAEPGFTGIDSVRLVADDGRGKSDPGFIQFLVRDFSQPQPAGCRSLAANVRPDASRELGLTCPFTMSAYEIVISQPPTHGKLSAVSAHGVVTYTPDPGYVGPDAFVFHGRQGAVDGQPATVELNVGEPAALPADVVADRMIGPDPPGPAPAPETPQEDDEEQPQQEQPATPDAQPPVTIAPPPILAPSLHDVALQTMGAGIRAVVAELGGAQAFLPAGTPKPGARSAKLLAIACAQPCDARVKGKLVAGRRTAKLPGRSATLGAGRASAFAYRISSAQRRALKRPKRAMAVFDVKVRDAAGAVHQDQIRVRLILR